MKEPKAIKPIIALFFLLVSFQSIRAEQDGVKHLVDELTTTPERQQLALDELAKFKDAELVELFGYFSDERSLASEEINFLNISRYAPGKYYMTRAVRVNEVLVRYVCWRTALCIPTFESSEINKVMQQLKIDFKHKIKP